MNRSCKTLFFFDAFGFSALVNSKSYFEDFSIFVGFLPIVCPVPFGIRREKSDK